MALSHDAVPPTAADARRLIDSGDLSAEQLVSASIDRIAARDEAVGAWTCLDGAAAIAAARAIDSARKRGEELPPLAGIPVGIKDIIDTRDFPTERGTPVFAGRQPEQDAQVATLLKAAGAIILGKTVTTELAFFGPGKTRNPVDPKRTPGGSSSGSAAAVADHHVPLALGTQTAGSIIRPAAYCGSIGFKPTFGAVSRTGVLPQSAPLDTIGGYARSIEDIALLMDCISGFDARDADMRDVPRTNHVAAVRAGMTKPPRIAFVKTPQWMQADSDARHAIEELAGRIGRHAEIVEMPLAPAFDGSLRLQQIIQFSDIARNYGPIADANPDVVSNKLKDVIAEGRSFSAADYAAAQAERDPLYERLTPLFASYDVILTPAAMGVAPLGLASTGSPLFNALWTYLGMPCLSLPLITLNGLPLGVQLVGTRDGDAALLSAAQWLSDAVGVS